VGKYSSCTIGHGFGGNAYEVVKISEANDLLLQTLSIHHFSLARGPIETSYQALRDSARTESILGIKSCQVCLR
jgi:hypothetical protein